MNESESQPVITARKRTRSPAYPAIDLEEALQKAAKLWEKAKRHWVGINDAVKYWGYEETSSTGHSALSALKKFGLLDERGVGEAREVKLTDAAIKLVFNPDTTSPEYMVALKTAALLPSIHADLWTRYEGEPPDDAIIERYLVIEKMFNSLYVKPFIKQFRTTVEFSKLESSDKVLGNQDSRPDGTRAVPRSSASVILPRLSPSPTGLTPSPRETDSTYRRGPVSEGHREIRLPHPAGDITISGPFPMTESDWATFTTLINAFKTWLVSNEPPAVSVPVTASQPPSGQPVSGEQG
jgi:hypothetical protein